MTIFAWACCAIALGGLLVEVANLPEFPVLQPAASGSGAPEVAICMAVRDEAANVEAVVAALLRAPEVTSLVVCDDDSADATREMLLALSRDEPRIVVTDPALAPGKAAALARAAQIACTRDPQWLLFVDADVRLYSGAVPALLEYALRRGVDAVSAWPRPRIESVWDALFAPLVVLLLLQALPMRRARTNEDPASAAGNGQLFLVRRSAYQRCGGHRAGTIVEDVALAHALKRSGARIALASAADIAGAAGYRSLRNNVEGYGRSIFAAGGVRAIAAFAGWQLIAFVVPWLLLPVAFVPAALGVGMGIVAHAIVARRMRLSRTCVLQGLSSGIAGVAAAGWVTIAGMRGELRWRGRALRDGASFNAS